MASDELFGHPKGLYVCFFTEMWERFSFYGMKALLFLYLTKYHRFADGPSYDLLGAYGGLVYAVPVVGGLLADRYLGLRKAVVLGGVLLVLGHLGMAIEGTEAQVIDGVVHRDERALQVFYLSLSLIIMGVGFLKPNISTIVGRLYAEDDPRRDSGFTIFYAGINVGGLFSSLVCGWLGETYGWRYGFGAAGVGMVAGLVMFLSLQRHLKGLAEAPDAVALKRKVAGVSFEHRLYAGAALGVLGVWQVIQRGGAVQGAMHVVSAIFIGWFVWFIVTQCTKVQREQMLALAALIMACLVFFSLYEQTYGSWVAFTDRMMTKRLVGFDLTAGALTFLGSFFIVAFAPLFAGLWPLLERAGVNPSKPTKSALGLMIAGLSFIPLWWAAKNVNDAQPLASVWWLVGAYVVLEVGESFISPIGLSAVTQLSVNRVVSLMMGAWFLATAYSEVIAAAFGKLTSTGEVDGAVPLAVAAAKYADSFQLMIWLGLGSGLVFLVLSRPISWGMHGVK
jgi:POT family proton-dependent oligopeptide transporter